MAPAVANYACKVIGDPFYPVTEVSGNVSDVIADTDNSTGNSVSSISDYIANCVETIVDNPSNCPENTLCLCLRRDLGLDRDCIAAERKSCADDCGFVRDHFLFGLFDYIDKTNVSLYMA